MWETTNLPANETWCWVTDNRSIWIAKRSNGACGGWTNDDTWEDWNAEVKAWIQLEMPALPISGGTL